MWKPNDVVAEHRTRATLVWVGLLLSVVAFVAWQTKLLVKKYENPSTTFTVSELGGVLLTQIVKLLEGQHISLTTDGWASIAYDTYHSFTVSLNDNGWNMRTLSLDYPKATGSAKEEDLAKCIIGQVKNLELIGRVTAFTTNCERSMVIAGRLVEEKGVAEHNGCCNHRLECATGNVFNGPGVQVTKASSRLVVRCYTTLSQAAQEASLEFLKMRKLKVIRD